MKYLFISPHVDDAELSCGGFISLLKERGHHVGVVTLSQNYQDPTLKKVNLLQEWKESVLVNLKVNFAQGFDFTTREFYKKQDEILQALYGYDYYDFVIAPSSKDIHLDHSVVGNCARRVFKNKNLITYTGEWNGNQVKNYFVKLERKHIESKIRALSCYQSQSFRSYMSPDYIWANARNNGVMAGCEFSEAFEVINIYDS